MRQEVPCLRMPLDDNAIVNGLYGNLQWGWYLSLILGWCAENAETTQEIILCTIRM